MEGARVLINDVEAGGVVFKVTANHVAVGYDDRCMLGGEAAARQVPSTARRELAIRKLLRKGGPTGDNTRNGLRA